MDNRNRAFDAFFAETERRAYQMAYFAVSSREDALDLVQDAMMKLVQSYGDRPQDEWRPLFYRILQHRIRDHYRRQKVRSVVRGWFGNDNGEDEDASAPDHGPGPQEGLANQQAMDGLTQAVEGLPLRQQQVFLLRTWEGLDVKETAKVMGCSEGSVKTHYSRAIGKLREALGEHWS